MENIIFRTIFPQVIFLILSNYIQSRIYIKKYYFETAPNSVTFNNFYLKYIVLEYDENGDEEGKTQQKAKKIMHFSK